MNMQTVYAVCPALVQDLQKDILGLSVRHTWENLQLYD